MRAVFDLDDTICVALNRDYENAEPVMQIIQKIRKMKDEGWEIVIYSSRGQISCNGDLKEIERKNRKVTEDWLVRNGVPFDELIFGKPIADIYVDDKGVSVSDFEKMEFGFLLGGGSSRNIYRIGSVVIKNLGGKDETNHFKEWVEDNNGSCLFPQVFSYLYDNVYMQYIDGIRLVDDCTLDDLNGLLDIIKSFSKMKVKKFELSPQIDILEKNRSCDEEWNKYIDISKKFIVSNEHFIAENASYCHGDLTLGNIIKGHDGLYLIDPRYFRESSSYLFDLARLRMSLIDYEFRFKLSCKRNSKYLEYFDSELNRNHIRDIVIGLNLMYICRLYRYKTDSGKEIVNML